MIATVKTSQHQPHEAIKHITFDSKIREQEIFISTVLPDIMEMLSLKQKSIKIK